MSQAAVYQALRNRVDTWTSTAKVWDAAMNETADAPQAAFIRPTFLEVAAQRATLGPNARRRSVGVILIQCFVPEGTGVAALDGYADSLKALLRDYSAAGSGWNLWVREPSARYVGNDESGRFQLNVEAEFFYDLIA